MKDYSQIKLWGKISAAILVLLLILASMDMYMNAESSIYNLAAALGLLSAGYFVLDGANYLIIKKRSGYNTIRLVTAIVFIIIGIILLFVSDLIWLDYSVILAIYYLTLGYSRDRVKSEQLHYRLAVLLGIVVLAGCITALILWKSEVSGISTFSLLIAAGALLTLIASFLEIKCFKIETLAALEYWSVASFVLIYCCTALIPQLIY